jgi:hypothetical protein
MRTVLKVVSWLALAGIVVPPILYFDGALSHETLNTVMLVATVVWFASTPFWMDHGTQS